MKKLVYIYKFFSENSVKKLTRKFWLMVILSLSSTLIISVQPLLMAKVINVISLDDAAPFYVVMLLIISYVIIISIRRLVAAFNFLVLIEVRNEIVTYLSAIYLKNIFDNKSLKKKYENTGGLTQNLNQTTEEISVLLKNMVSNFIPPAFQLLFSIIAIMFSGDILVASFFGLYFFIYIFVKRLYNPRIISLYEDFYATSVKRYSLLTDSIKNIEVARASGSFDYMFNRYRDHLNNIEVKHKELLRYDARFLAVEALLAILFFGVVFTITLFRVINRDVSVGHFVMISSYILLLSGPLETIGAMYTAVLKSTNSAYNFLASINQQIQPGKTGVVLPRSEMSITVDKVFFVYEGSHEWLFQGVEVKFNKCHFTTVTGISGSGKSTLAKLICKMLVPAQGRVLFNSTDIAGAGDDEFAQAIYYVNQEEFIFMATLRFNLRIANPVASDGDVINALNLAELNELIDGSELEDPLDLKIGDDGETLSGGQKQRLSLARLFLRNPKIIVLDEATSALDIITEKKVLMNIRTRFPAATIINISHRPSTFEFSDEIIIFESGTVVERGDLSYLQENSVAFKKILEANHSRCQ